jgi:membrane protein
MKLFTFFRKDIWEISEDELSVNKARLIRFVKIFILSIRGFVSDQINVKASALTYSVLLAIVPFLALIMAIARGFGVDKFIEDSLQRTMIAQPDSVPVIMGFIDRYLKLAQGGIFIGVGLIILFWSIMAFMRKVENAFNSIWHVKKSRSIVRQFSTYFSFILIIPILLVFSSGLSIFVNSAITHSFVYDVLNPIMRFAVKFTPYVLDWLAFTLLYLMIPNTRVRFVHAFLAGFVAGSIFQLFQLLYIHGQVFLSRYNVVYGGFAAIPLFFIWLQFSCLIVLLGAEISFASQNIKNYEHNLDIKKISVRYKNFLTLFIAHVIVKQFEDKKAPLTSEQIAVKYKLPIRLTNQLISDLVDTKILIQIHSETSRLVHYLPAFDINQLTVNLLFERLESKGSEMFLINKDELIDKFWHKTLEIRDLSDKHLKELLIKDF